MFHSKAQKIVVWADIIICLLFSFIFSTPIGALLLIIVISVIVAIVYFEIRGYKKEKTVKHLNPGESGGMKNHRQDETSAKQDVNTAESTGDQWRSLYENGFITREEYAECFEKK